MRRVSSFWVCAEKSISFCHCHLGSSPAFLEPPARGILALKLIDILSLTFLSAPKISLIMPELPDTEFILKSFWFVSIYLLLAKPASGSESQGKNCHPSLCPLRTSLLCLCVLVPHPLQALLVPCSGTGVAAEGAKPPA